MDATVGGKKYNFLVEEPEWAEDFAPNGKCGMAVHMLEPTLNYVLGTLVKLGDIMTRKRYAE